MDLSFGQVALRGGAGLAGRALANWATGVPSWLQTAPYKSTSSLGGGK